MKCETPALALGLVPRAGADPVADGDRADVRRPSARSPARPSRARSAPSSASAGSYAHVRDGRVAIAPRWRSIRGDVDRPPPNMTPSGAANWLGMRLLLWSVDRPVRALLGVAALVAVAVVVLTRGSGSDPNAAVARYLARTGTGRDVSVSLHEDRPFRERPSGVRVLGELAPVSTSRRCAPRPLLRRRRQRRVRRAPPAAELATAAPVARRRP